MLENEYSKQMVEDLQAVRATQCKTEWGFFQWEKLIVRGIPKCKKMQKV